MPAKYNIFLSFLNLRRSLEIFQFPSSLFAHIIRIIIRICIRSYLTLALYRRAGIAEIRPEPGKNPGLGGEVQEYSKR